MVSISFGFSSELMIDSSFFVSAIKRAANSQRFVSCDIQLDTLDIAALKRLKKVDAPNAIDRSFIDALVLDDQDSGNGLSKKLFNTLLETKVPDEMISRYVLQFKDYGRLGGNAEQNRFSAESLLLFCNSLLLLRNRIKLYKKYYPRISLNSMLYTKTIDSVYKELFVASGQFNPMLLPCINYHELFSLQTPIQFDACIKNVYGSDKDELQHYRELIIEYCNKYLLLNWKDIEQKALIEDFINDNYGLFFDNLVSSADGDDDNSLKNFNHIIDFEKDYQRYCRELTDIKRGILSRKSISEGACFELGKEIDALLNEIERRKESFQKDSISNETSVLYTMNRIDLKRIAQLFFDVSLKRYNNAQKDEYIINMKDEFFERMFKIFMECKFTPTISDVYGMYINILYIHEVLDVVLDYQVSLLDQQYPEVIYRAIHDCLVSKFLEFWKHTILKNHHTKVGIKPDCTTFVHAIQNEVMSVVRISYEPLVKEFLLNYRVNPYKISDKIHILLDKVFKKGVEYDDFIHCNNTLKWYAAKILGYIELSPEEDVELKTYMINRLITNSKAKDRDAFETQGELETSLMQSFVSLRLEEK